MYKINVVTYNGRTVRFIRDVEAEECIQQRAAADCERCLTDVYVPHYTCLYKGKAIGHSEGHCTANACY